MKTKQPLESWEQERVARWLDARDIIWAHIPNEGKRSLRTGAALKRQGLKPGAPDIMVFSTAPDFPAFRGVAIELKRVNGDKPTANQQRWLKDLDRVGWYSAVCEGHEEAIQVLESLGW